MAAEEGGDDNGGLWGVGALLGASLLGGLLSSEAQEKTNTTNMELGQKMMDFQREMSNTSYQRGVIDMQKAGLNPMLAYSQGGASTPSGTMPRVENKIASGVASANQTAQVMSAAQQYQTQAATQENIKASTAKTESETLSRNLHSAKLAADIEQTKQSAASLKETAINTSQQILGTISDSARKRAEFESMASEHEGKGKTGFNADVDRRKAEAKEKQYGLSEKRAYSDYYETPIGRAEPYIGLGSSVINSASRAKTAYNPATHTSRRVK